MTLTDFSIRRPVFVWMLTFALVFFGVVSFFNLGISKLPEATVPVLTIEAHWTGAAPELMESEIVNPIEQALMSVEGLQDVEADMQQGMATLKLTFHPDKNIDTALQESNSKLRSVKLPADVQPPTILKINTDDLPIMWLVVTSKTRPIKDIVPYANRELKNRLQAIPGVGHLIFGGWTERNLRVWVDNNKLLGYQLTVLDVENTLKMENEEIPSGYLENDRTQINVRTMGEATTPQELGDLIIRQRGGVSIYHSKIHLRDVATIEDSLNDVRSFARTNDIPTVAFGVQKQAGANEVATGRAIRAFVDQENKYLERTQPDLHLGICYDSTHFTSEAVNHTEITVLFSVIITGLLCWAFLGSWSTTFNVLISIPVSVLGTFIVMNALGFTLNFLTLIALGLSVGLVVDDAIMVLENITRHFRMGKTAAQAASEGTRQIMPAATATSLAVIVVFLPAVLMRGFVGTFLFQFGLTLSVAVALSLLEAITMTPMRCFQFMATRASETNYARNVNRVFDFAAERYRHILAICLEHRWKVILVSSALFLASLSSLPFLKKEMVPSMDMGFFLIQFQAPAGASLEFTDSKVRQLEKILREERAVHGYFVECGGETGDVVNSGHVFVMLQPQSERHESPREIIDRVRGEIKQNIPEGLQTHFLDLTKDMWNAKRSTDIELSVRGDDYEVLKDKVAEMTGRFAASGLMTDIDTDFRDGLTEVQVEPDRDKAAASGVSVEDIARTIHAAIGGVRQGKFTNGPERYDVRMRLMPEQWQSEGDIKRLLVRTNYGEMIPLSAVTDIHEERRLQTITREMRQRSINIYANTASGASLDKALQMARQTAGELLPSGYHMTEVGASQDAIDAAGSLFLALVLGLGLSYMVLAVQFNSFIHPLPVFATLPFTLTGALLALLVTHQSLNIYSVIGIVLLMGIAKKNAILLVDYFNRHRRTAGLDKNEAILQGASLRLRPILMTSAATVCGALPGNCLPGAGAEMLFSLTVTVIGGIIVSTLFSLIIVPCLFSIMAGCEDANIRIAQELDEADSLQVPAWFPPSNVAEHQTLSEK